MRDFFCYSWFFLLFVVFLYVKMAVSVFSVKHLFDLEGAAYLHFAGNPSSGTHRSHC